MKEDIAKKWVEALRSGNYTQTDGCLHNNKGFCCLGVLCDLVKDEVEGNWIKDKDIDGKEREFFKFGGIDWYDSGDSGVLPHSVMKHSGMKTPTGDYIGVNETDGTHCRALSADNDSGMNFEQIADIIEQKWNEL